MNTNMFVFTLFVNVRSGAEITVTGCRIRGAKSAAIYLFNSIGHIYDNGRTSEHFVSIYKIDILDCCVLFFFLLVLMKFVDI
jgi:hypothetical protein